VRPLPDNRLEDLESLNRIAETLNRAVDVRSALDSALDQLLAIMALDTAWILLRTPLGQEGAPFELAAHRNLPPALEDPKAWESGCYCQDLCLEGKLTAAYTEVGCSRLAEAEIGRRDLQVHASSPLRSGGKTLGILNVAGRAWVDFDERALALLTNVGAQLGVTLERASLYDALREQRVQEQAALLDASRQLLSRAGLAEVTSFLVEEVRRLAQVDACALLLPDAAGGELQFLEATGWRHDPRAAGRRIPLNDASGPGRVMRTHTPLLLEDLQAHDPTAWSASWIQEEDFRGHVVLPLIAEGQTIGVLILNSRQPCSMGDDTLRFIQLMANQGAIALEKARLQEEEIHRRELDHELDLAREIQFSLLPGTPPPIEGWELASFYRAARQVGGDFYDWFPLPSKPGRYGVAVGDVTGKGVPAALYMGMCKTAIRAAAVGGSSPAETLKAANLAIVEDGEAALLLSTFYCEWEPETGHLIWANAGHDPPFWIPSQDPSPKPLETTGMILGVDASTELEERELLLEAGDSLILYTDGAIDALAPDGERYGRKRFKKAIASRRSLSAEGHLQALVQDIDAFVQGEPQADDLTLLILRRVS